MVTGCGKGVGWHGFSSEGIEFWKLEWKAQHATERSGVKCGAWNGSFQNSPRRGHAASEVASLGALCGLAGLV